MEMSDEETEDGEVSMGEEGYGVETDWWSTGTIIYGMTDGVASSFARDIRSTYLRFYRLEGGSHVQYERACLV